MKTKVYFKKVLTIDTDNLKKAAELYGAYPINDGEFLVNGYKITEEYYNLDYVTNESNDDVTSEFIKYL